MKHLCLLLLFTGLTAVAQQIAPQTSLVDITQIQAILTPDLDQASIKGQVVVHFTPKKTVDSIRLDAKNMKVAAVTDQVEVSATPTHITIKGHFLANTSQSVAFEYSVTPKQTLYVVDHFGSKQLWTQGQGKYTSHWLPSIDDMNEKIEFDLTIKAPSRYEVISNGKLVSKIKDRDITLWNYDMIKPMSSYLVAIAIGEYKSLTAKTASGIPIEQFYYPSDSLKVEPTYRHTQTIFEFFEKSIGIPYPWQNYKQLPVKDFLYAGMENTSCTLFSDSFMIDQIAFEDRNYVNVNAHELAHQWFGNLVTETQSKHHWLHEGFATYYALLAERLVFGEDYFYHKLYQSAEELKTLSDQGKGQPLVAAGGSSITYYQKGAWALHILNGLIGEEAFAKAVKGFLTRYAFSNATTDDFMAEVTKVTDVDLTSFSKNWLYQSAFQADDALQALKKSSFMPSYFRVQALRSVPFAEKRLQLLELIKSADAYLAQEAVYQLADLPLVETVAHYDAALNRSDLMIRQAVAESVSIANILEIPKIHDLLQDASYRTKEMMLYKLWVAHNTDATSGKEKQLEILDQTKDLFGFNDGNIRTLWLALSLITPGYEDQERQMNMRYEELKGYTSVNQPFQRRLQAFQYLAQIQLWDAQTLSNLVQACVHINWRFRQSARALLTQLLNTQRWKTLITDQKASFSSSEKAYLETLGL